MKRYTYLLIFALSYCLAVNAQTQADVKTQIDAASAALAKKDLRSVDKSLSQAMIALAKMAGKEITKMFPLELAGLKSVPENDMVQVSSSIMAPGNVIQRSYSSVDAGKKVEMTVRPFSPELSSVLMYMANPGYLKNADKQIEKVVSVNGRKALLKINGESKQAEVLIVSGNTLYSIEVSGADFSEAELISLASKIEIGKIETLLR